MGSQKPKKSANSSTCYLGQQSATRWLRATLVH